MNDAAGVARWPAALVELIFNAVMLGVALFLRSRKILSGQHFHIYLIAYGFFRFAHEFVRDTPQVVGVFSGYQVAALSIVALGGWGFWRRRREQRDFERRSVVEAATPV